MTSRSKKQDALVYVLAVCTRCRALFAELQSEFYARQGPNKEAPYCISHDPEADKPALEGVTLAGWAEKD